MEKKICLAGGCFWGVQHYFSMVPGVIETTAGYANGKTEQVSYEEVSKGSGHAEAVLIRYEDSQVSLEELLRLFYDAIDPTTFQQQGNDIGIQYRSGIYYLDQEEVIRFSLNELQKQYQKPLAIEVEPLRQFCEAEENHQFYLKKHSNGYCHLPLPLFKRAQFPHLTKTQYLVTQEGDTEPPFANQYWDFEGAGIYVDVITKEPLFSSLDKFPSACGWPSFSKPYREETVENHLDFSHGMVRKEVKSVSSNSHLGHVFKDGPKALGGKRYCINSAALEFVPLEKALELGYLEKSDFF